MLVQVAHYNLALLILTFFTISFLSSSTSLALAESPPALGLIPAHLVKRGFRADVSKAVALMSNAERLRAGMPLLPPKRMYNPTRVHGLARRSEASPLPVDHVEFDGGFEAYQPGQNFAYTMTAHPTWKAESEGTSTDSASFFYNQPYAHTGNVCALLGSAAGSNAHAGSISPRDPLNTLPGIVYLLTLWVSTNFSNQGSSSWFEVYWNGVMIQRVQPGNVGYTKIEIVLPAAIGNDLLRIRGGSAPSWVFVDDVSLSSIVV